MLRRTDTPKLTVTDQTSLQELKAFSDSAGDNAKIRGKRKGDTITLYASRKKGTGLENSVKDDRTGKQGAARYAINKVLTGAGGMGGDRLNVLMTPVRQQLRGTGEILGKELAKMVADASAAEATAVENARDFKQIGGSLKDALVSGNAPARQHLAAELGSRIATYMRGKSIDEQTDFAVSHGDQFKSQILAAMAMGLPDPGPLATSYQHAPPELKAVLDDAYQQAACQLSNRRVDANTLVLGGTVYTKDRHLSEGGFGTVDVYKAANGDEIAVKTPILKDGEDPAAKFDEAATEIQAHRRAVAGNPANVIGMKGIVRTPEGGLEIALELAPRGDAYSAINKLNVAARGDPATGLAPTITPQQANLARITMLRDMLEGLRHVQETAGMTHLDVKAPNFFVDANGVTKLGDFGTARTGAAHQLDQNPIDNPSWQAPELIKGTDRRAEVVNAFGKINRAAAAAAKAEIDRTLSEADQDVAKKNIKDTYDTRQERQVAAHAPKIGVTAKADTWAVGIDAYRLFTNESPFEAGFVSETKDKILTFAANPTNRVRLPDGVPPGLDALARSHLNAVLGQLMHPDPAQRPTLSQILQNPLFQLAGVGGQAARDVIKQVTT